MSALTKLDTWLAADHRRRAKFHHRTGFTRGHEWCDVELYDGGALTGRSDLPVTTGSSRKGSAAAAMDALREYERSVEEGRLENEQLDAHWAAQERAAIRDGGPLEHLRDNRDNEGDATP